MGSSMLFKSQAAATAYFDAAHRAKAEQDQPAQTAPAPAGYAAILAQIRELNDRIADEAISAKLDRMEQVSGRIFKLIEEDEAKRDAAQHVPELLPAHHPEAAGKLRQLRGGRCQRREPEPGQGQDRKRPWTASWRASEHQLDELYRTDAMDIDSDIRVMETMLRRDTASVADDFGLNGSSAVQQRMSKRKGKRSAPAFPFCACGPFPPRRGTKSALFVDGTGKMGYNVGNVTSDLFRVL